MIDNPNTLKTALETMSITVLVLQFLEVTHNSILTRLGRKEAKSNINISNSSPHQTLHNSYED